MDNPEWLRRADLLVISPEGERSEDFAAGIQRMRPELPQVTEKVPGGIPQDLEMSLRNSFVAYKGERERIKAMLDEHCLEKSLSCSQTGR